MSDRVNGPNGGAPTTLTAKPFAMEELIARVRRCCASRVQRLGAADPLQSLPGYDGPEPDRGGKPVALTRRGDRADPRSFCAARKGMEPRRDRRRALWV